MSYNAYHEYFPAFDGTSRCQICGLGEDDCWHSKATNTPQQPRPTQEQAFNVFQNSLNEVTTFGGGVIGYTANLDPEASQLIFNALKRAAQLERDNAELLEQKDELLKALEDAADSLAYFANSQFWKHEHAHSLENATTILARATVQGGAQG